VDATAVDAAAPVDGATEERAVAHLEEELGDLLFQVYFHATLAAEAGRFTLADVARGVHDKLVDRHPHVFGDVTADTPEEVATNWEARKLVEKGRSSVTEGIPAALPALALAAKLQRKALAVGMSLPSVADEAVRVADGVAELGRLDEAGHLYDGQPPSGVADGEGGGADRAARLGELLFSLANVARALGIDPETALRARAATFRDSVEARG
jgi:MazG family protein